MRIQEISKHLGNAGFDVSILTPFKEDLSNVADANIIHIPSAFSNLGLTTYSYKLARKLAASTLTSSFFLSRRSIARMARDLEQGLSKLMKTTRFDVLHAVQPLASIASSRLANMYSTPLVTDLHNIWPEEILAHGLCKRNDRTFNFLHETEQLVIDSSSALTVVSENMKCYLEENYCSGTKSIVTVPPAGPIVSENQDQSREENVVYAGMVNFREYVDLFATSIPLVKNNCSFYISDYGDAIKTIKKATKGYQTKVNYVWFTKRNDVLNFLMRAKIGILTSHDDITRQLGPPLKLYDYMACGLPVVANDIGGWSSMIESDRLGLLADDSPTDFANCIDELLSNRPLWEEIHENCLNKIKSKYNWGTIIKNSLIPLYESLVN